MTGATERCGGAGDTCLDHRRGPGRCLLGLSGLVAAPVAGILIQNFGFTVHYVFIGCICLLALIPISMIRE